VWHRRLGSACAGDPAVDVQVVWSPLFTDDSRRAFLDALDVDDATVTRSCGAAINQACAALPYYLHTYPHIVERSLAQAGNARGAAVGVITTSALPLLWRSVTGPASWGIRADAASKKPKSVAAGRNVIDASLTGARVPTRGGGRVRRHREMPKQHPVGTGKAAGMGPLAGAAEQTAPSDAQER
jgi:hypothetical protein